MTSTRGLPLAGREPAVVTVAFVQHGRLAPGMISVPTNPRARVRLRSLTSAQERARVPAADTFRAGPGNRRTPYSYWRVDLGAAKGEPGGCRCSNLLEHGSLTSPSVRHHRRRVVQGAAEESSNRRRTLSAVCPFDDGHRRAPRTGSLGAGFRAVRADLVEGVPLGFRLRDAVAVDPGDAGRRMMSRSEVECSPFRARCPPRWPLAGAVHAQHERRMCPR